MHGSSGASQNVRGEVLKVFRHTRYISYFISYRYEAASRVAEYREGSLITSYKQGAPIELLIDRSAPPNVSLPCDTHAVWFNSSASACVLADESVFSLWDFAMAIAAIVLIVTS
jgi:hypothetical protein